MRASCCCSSDSDRCSSRCVRTIRWRSARRAAEATRLSNSGPRSATAAISAATAEPIWRESVVAHARTCAKLIPQKPLARMASVTKSTTPPAVSERFEARRRGPARVGRSRGGQVSPPSRSLPQPTPDPPQDERERAERDQRHEQTSLLTQLPPTLHVAIHRTPPSPSPIAPQTMSLMAAEGRPLQTGSSLALSCAHRPSSSYLGSA